MNHRIAEDEYMDCNDMFRIPIVGKIIKGIGFSHHEINRDKIHYNQPTIRLCFDDGTVICFTHNFGELPQKKSVSRFAVDGVF